MKVNSNKTNDIIKFFDHTANLLRNADKKAFKYDKIDGLDGSIQKAETKGNTKKWFNRLSRTIDKIHQTNRSIFPGFIKGIITYEHLNTLRELLNIELRRLDTDENGYVSVASARDFGGLEGLCYLIESISKECKINKKEKDVRIIETDWRW